MSFFFDDDEQAAGSSGGSSGDRDGSLALSFSFPFDRQKSHHHRIPQRPPRAWLLVLGSEILPFHDVGNDHSSLPARESRSPRRRNGKQTRSRRGASSSSREKKKKRAETARGAAAAASSPIKPLFASPIKASSPRSGRALPFPSGDRMDSPKIPDKNRRFKKKKRAEEVTERGGGRRCLFRCRRRLCLTAAIATATREFASFVSKRT